MKKRHIRKVNQLRVKLKDSVPLNSYKGLDRDDIDDSWFGSNQKQTAEPDKQISYLLQPKIKE